MKNLLWVGDACCPSGFARVTHSVLDTLRHHYNVTVLGLNYRGDPHAYPYPVYAAAAEGDSFGLLRINWMCDKTKPDVIVLQQDPWNIPSYLQALRQVKEHGQIPVVGVTPVDGKNCNGKALNGLAMNVFLTQFGLDEAKIGGYAGASRVIQHGIDHGPFRKLDDKKAARAKAFRTDILNDAFIVGCANRNQPRKRFDLLIRYFAKWVHLRKVKDAWLFLHVGPTGDTGVNVIALAKYYGIADRLALHEPPTFYGIDDEALVATYNAMDVFANTTQGEGWGLTVMEAMACGTPVIAPDWAALGEWAKGAAWLVPCTSTAVGPPYDGVIGGVPDEKAFVEALDRLYRDPIARENNSKAGLECVGQDRFKWEHVGGLFLEAIEAAMVPAPISEEIWKDLGRPEEALA